ncbi:uncharacterized protein DDB_G0275275 [Teleopsis dalmanni]|uniref:uncharacterized protein DDB_G0275275 n=1 Tax=Teleopsis dalmanni TaxID=139649 RepID=UPI0018CE3EDF|nr:uncharacterized protein DDB_G0275275 [Teleopsis dalmanni]XP_037938786.1 uncharacterized protein DDB_G0275275 [Teleopsis dalmanni]XP_037938787.1 uncharacterized protein DDB_G0275275 [Teleopsis dalmanni]XP_037938788.1 uncharacterized protein DDB_G0275275 [Teleopsis dalmanni]
MLSTVDSFGPVTGPSAALAYAHHHHHHHNTYTIAAIAAANATIPQTPLLQTVPTKAEHLQQSHLIQQALIATPIITAPFVDSLTNKFLKQNVSLNSSQHLNQLSHTYIPQTINNNLKRLKLKEDLESDMSINTFLQPNPKQHRFNGTIPENQSSKNCYQQPISNNNNYYANDNSGAMNLVTTGANSNSSTHNLERDHSTSCSPVDIENDDSMSPHSIPAPTRKPVDIALMHQPLASNEPTNITATNALPTTYPFNYAHLYANGAALYSAPLVFSAHQTHHQTPNDIASSHETYLNALHAHHNIESGEANSFSAEYIKAAMAAGILNSAQTHHLTQSHKNVLSSYKSNSALPFTMTPAYTRTTKSPNTSNNQRQKSESDTKTTTTPMIKYSTGTYLNDKVNISNNESGTNNYFKVPNGKEGSLKHRILTRPTNTESPEITKNSVMRTYNTTSNFIKGSYIELSNGVLRKVEDMRTEDFISCAERSQHHQLAESTVVKITSTPNKTVVIQFSYDKNRSKVDIEVSSDHPFFVYGQGWASCNIEKSLEAFGLKCQRLQVGDICISLTQRNQTNISRTPKSTVEQSTSWTNLSMKPSNANGYTHNDIKLNSDHLDISTEPDNLSMPKPTKNDFQRGTPNMPNNSIYTVANQSADSSDQTTDVISRKRRWSAPES